MLLGKYGKIWFSFNAGNWQIGLLVQRFYKEINIGLRFLPMVSLNVSIWWYIRSREERQIVDDQGYDDDEDDEYADEGWLCEEEGGTGACRMMACEEWGGDGLCLLQLGGYTRRGYGDE